MMQNVHVKTGIPYGVVDARNLPSIYEEILQNGTHNNYNSALNERIERLKGCETPKEVNAIVDELHYSDSHHVDNMEFDVEELATYLMETWEYDEYETVDYENDNYKYHLTTLGGAPFIYILESPFVATCRPCSPCFPNAGNLDNITEIHGGNVAYCFDPKDYESDIEFVIDNETTPPTISKSNKVGLIEREISMKIRITKREIEEMASNSLIGKLTKYIEKNPESIKENPRKVTFVFQGSSSQYCKQNNGPEQLVVLDSLPFHLIQDVLKLQKLGIEVDVELEEI